MFKHFTIAAALALALFSAQAQAGYASGTPRATQAEAEAGSNSTKFMSPLRTYQQNTARLSSQAEAQAGTDNVKLITPLRAKEAIQTYALRNTGEVLKETICADNVAVTLSGVSIPLDDTIPTSTEGDQVGTCAYTQNINAGKIIVTANVYMAQGNTSITCTAFLDSDSAAFGAAASSSMGSAAVVGGFIYTFYNGNVTSGAHTVKIRCASNASAAIYMNGTSTGRKYGGVLSTIISIREIK